MTEQALEAREAARRLVDKHGFVDNAEVSVLPVDVARTIDILAAALDRYAEARVAEAVGAEREACADFIDVLADELDQRAAAASNQLVHGILTDQACALRNLADAIRQRATAGRSPHSSVGAGEERG
jgi:hypothetical protein